ncbi:AI-2E family transporter [Babesia caballi]|uniref:AI-2E family transporter n=1 Tax=Babesia caballi TaxID=5871 RepID=A0AAV4M1S7_BABCB|nr:AI-2E family transporter [Babesia caballi]
MGILGGSLPPGGVPSVPPETSSALADVEKEPAAEFEKKFPGRTSEGITVSVLALKDFIASKPAMQLRAAACSAAVLASASTQSCGSSGLGLIQVSRLSSLIGDVPTSQTTLGRAVGSRSAARGTSVTGAEGSMERFGNADAAEEFEPTDPREPRRPSVAAGTPSHDVEWDFFKSLGETGEQSPVAGAEVLAPEVELESAELEVDAEAEVEVNGAEVELDPCESLWTEVATEICTRLTMGS